MHNIEVVRLSVKQYEILKIAKTSVENRIENIKENAREWKRRKLEKFFIDFSSSLSITEFCSCDLFVCMNSEIIIW